MHNRFIRSFWILSLHLCQGFFAPGLFAQSPTNLAQDFVPAAQIASIDDNWALFKNPAGLGFIQGLHFTPSYYYEWMGLEDRHHGAALLSSNLFEGFTLSGGFNFSGAGRDHGKPASQTFLLGSALNASNRFALGFSLKYPINLSQSSLWTLGTQMRLSPVLALGGVYEQVQEGLFQPQSMRLGVSYRPFGPRFTFGLDARLYPHSNQFQDGFRLDPIFAFRSDVGGFSAYAAMEVRDIRYGWGAPIFTLGFDLHTEFLSFGFMGGAHIQRDHYLAGTRFRAATEQYPSLVEERNEWVMLSIGDNGTFEEKPSSMVSGLFFNPPHYLAVLATLKSLAEDKRVEGVVVTLDNLSFGSARAFELKDALQNLRNNNKKLIIHLRSASALEYFIATAADRVFMLPSATLSLDRFRTTLVYLADTLEKIGVKAESIAAGRYKTAPRMFTDNKPQKEEIEVTQNILSNFYNEFIQAIQGGRSLQEGTIKGLINKGDVVANEALASHLVDELLYEDQIEKSLSQWLSKPILLRSDYLTRKVKELAWAPAGRFVVIPISGEIVPGRVYPQLFSFFSRQTGADDIVDIVEGASADPSVNAILVRIDSPGGDSTASNQIYHSLMEARLKKPVLISMGDMAASGGYYVAAAGQHIFAEPTTLTGSIGVWSLFFSGKELAHKIGVNDFEFKKGENPGPTMFRGLTPTEREQYTHMIDWFYQQFKEAVAAGQNLSVADVEQIAQGRVWTGTEALQKKLIQEIGGFLQAVEKAKTMANLSPQADVSVEIAIPGFSDQARLSSNFFQFVTGINEKSQSKPLNAMLKPYQHALEMYGLEGKPLARLPYNLEQQ